MEVFVDGSERKLASSSSYVHLVHKGMTPTNEDELYKEVTDEQQRPVMTHKE
jgi:hypothetical protein